MRSKKRNMLSQISTEMRKSGRQNKLYGKFLCECGNIVECTVTKVRNNEKTHCGCQKYKKDIHGKRFTRLLVESFAGEINGSQKWKCICDCGNIVYATYNILKSKQVQSCGCLHKDIMKSRRGVERKPKINNVGQVINGYKIIEFIESSDVRKMPYYKCECKCGFIHEISHSNLMANKYNCIGCKYKNMVYGNITVLNLVSTNPVEFSASCICGNKFINKLDKIKCMGDCGCLYKKELNDKRNEKRSKYPIDPSYLNRLYHCAKRRGYEFSVSYNELYELFLKQNNRCAISGMNITLSYDNMTSSVDRINSSYGYYIDNLQWVHKDVNFIKMEYSNQYVIDSASEIANFNYIFDHRDIEIIHRRKSYLGVGNFSKSHYNGIVNDAKKRSLQFDLDMYFLWDLYLSQNGRCKLTGREIDFGIIRNGTASLDRINSSIGYHKSNVQWLHRDINFMKGKLNQEYFINICRNIHDYNN